MSSVIKPSIRQLITIIFHNSPCTTTNEVFSLYYTVVWPHQSLKTQDYLTILDLIVCSFP